MGEAYFEDQVWDQDAKDLWANGPATFDGCRFSRLDFSGTSIAGFHFVDCLFEACNLSGVTLTGTVIRDSRFVACKMMGLHFDQCHEVLFDPHFDRCVLDLSSFYRRKMDGKSFAGCSLREVDFTETSLVGVDFTGADLTGAIFDQANLEKADFRQAVHVSIDPEKNKMRKAKFSVDGLPGLLEKYDLSIE